MQRHIGRIVLEIESENDNTMEIIMHCANKLYEDLDHKTLHVCNQNYFEVTV